MRALITNDDGIHTAGLQTLAQVAVKAGLDVIVAAPHVERSGASASLTALEEGGRLVLHEESLDGLDGVRALGVEATPGFIAFAAAHRAFGPPPDILLSGVNHGPNTGNAVLHSGTVGAALTARTHGASSLAVSNVAPSPEHWDTAAEMAERSLTWLLEHMGDDPLTLSVNVPDIPLSECKGLRAARLAAFGAVQADVGEAGEGYVTMTFSEVDEEAEPGTDAYLLAEGWATVTSLAAPCEAEAVDLSGLAEPG
ncbi:MAG TPA: 5'/3'-nucleotidase SurE [Nocardioidaceae bacterium]|jgi:5'-nucleotidase|nr:5'/3'-nucleotidase SurE [Nocardioidaceae bacterium]